MLFNSIDYLIFLAVALSVFYALPPRYRCIPMLLASYYFYMSWNAHYIILIVASTLLDYSVGLALGRTDRVPRRRALLGLSLVANLGLLFVFKYWNFVNDSAGQLAMSMGSSWSVPSSDLLLPVGISFYTFQTLSYTIDVYRRRMEPERNLARFALYVTLFPQLVAGPIERADKLLPQIKSPAPFDDRKAVSGLLLILWGLFKKVVIADRLALYVDVVYGAAEMHNGATCLLATYAFAFQIYCDFSGYTDIAIGSARLFGFDLMKNFNSPYFARGMKDFWSRWHISLSTWLRDYLYIPLGGNRRGEVRTYANLLITMLLGGLWHGANWNFVIWGALHGVALALLNATSAWRERGYARLPFPRWALSTVQLLVTFHFVCLTWVFFRADTLADAMLVLNAIATTWAMPYLKLTVLTHAFLGLAVLLAVEVAQSRPGWQDALLTPRATAWRVAAMYSMIFCIVLLGVQQGSQFVYFQF